MSKATQRLPFQYLLHRGRHSFLWIAPLTLDPYLIILSLKPGSIKYHFCCLDWDWIPLANTQTIMSIYIGIIQWLLFIQQHCFQQILHQMMGSGMVSEQKHHYQSAPAVTHDTTRLCWIVVTLWDCHINADAIIVDIFYVFPLVWRRKSKISQECRSWVGNETSTSDLDRKYIGYPAISDTLFSQILIFFSLRWCAQSKFSSKETINAITKIFNLMDQMTTSGCWVINTISVGNTKWCFKSVVTCQSVQPSNNYDLYLFLLESFEMFPSLTKWMTLLVILLRALFAVSQHIFAASAKISRTSLCLHV